jgi:hypothetical protein
MLNILLRRALALFSVMAMSQLALGESARKPNQLPSADSEQTAHILGLDVKVNQLRALRTRGSDDPAAAIEEMRLRQDLLESIQAAILDAESVLAEIANERGQLADLRFSLQNRRDRTVGRLNAAALLTGSGLGVAVSASQFTTLGSRTQNIGDGIGIASGVVSTLLLSLPFGNRMDPAEPLAKLPTCWRLCLVVSPNRSSVVTTPSLCGCT